MDETERVPTLPLYEHNHPRQRGIRYHAHDRQRGHWHVDDGPAGKTAAEAGFTADLPPYPARFPEEA